jgi:hypothetical protein
MSDEQFPKCPDCGERHPPQPNFTPVGKVRDKLNRRVSKLMALLKDLDPEFALRLLITMLSSVARAGNVATRQNVVRILADNLGLKVMFGIQAPSPEELADWKPGKVDPKDVN